MFLYAGCDLVTELCCKFLSYLDLSYGFCLLWEKFAWLFFFLKLFLFTIFYIASHCTVGVSQSPEKTIILKLPMSVFYLIKHLTTKFSSFSNVLNSIETNVQCFCSSYRDILCHACIGNSFLFSSHWLLKRIGFIYSTVGATQLSTFCCRR